MNKKKRSRVRRKKSWYVVWSMFFFFFLGTIVFLFISLPIWKVKDVVVTGCLTIDQERIVELASVPFEKNIFFVDLRDVERKIKTIKAVKSVKASRQLPNSVLIRVVERHGQAVVVFEKVSYLIDDEGAIVDPSEGAAIDMHNLPVIVGVRKEWLKEGRLSADVTAGVFSLLEQLQQDINPKRIQIDINEGDNIVLLLDDVLYVKIGSPLKIAEKIKVLKQLLKNLSYSFEMIEYIDVQSPQFPAVKPVD